ncbi:c-type cytochrome [Rhodalgimonas zhirmunskyi]|uniref:Cytochrome c family protein n=1 Tax=Rhodalgimonas zhirmunskyi TaxID=2964767 RepID=A0AAJ1X5H9_9RHOB|nr:cytochrome c family protein [Rhodoalgimonas zhirmunskyi]MDQ2094174.1 cytochrome c family protein [Rhodoalgimonas zhirmunskyi]
MFDTMTTTKVIGAFCGALLIFMLGNWAAMALYTTGGGHGDEHAASYVIEVESDDEAPSEEAGPTFEELLASADVGKGAKVFGKCKACHKIEPGANATGPTLHAVVGRAVDSVDGFSYSGALEAVGEQWTPENLNVFLADPKGTAPGTKMSFAGLKKETDRANLIAYLSTLE